MKKILVSLIILFLLTGFVSAADPVYQKSVLALYKSSEGQTKAENEIFFYLSRPLKEMGLKIIYWDIDRGLPGESVTKYSRAIISWFRGPSMRNPGDYLTFLDTMIEDGKKVIVIDNLGAYQDKATGEYMQPLRLNSTLARLGIMYHGDWTQDGSLLEITHKDSEMVEFQGEQIVKDSAFFYKFISSDREMDIWLSITRTDKDYAPSPVIVTNRNGGFALSRYIYRVEDGKVKLLLNMKKYLMQALFPLPVKQKIAILAESNNTKAQDVLGFTESVLRRAKIEYAVISTRDFRGMVPFDLNPFTAVGLILSSDNGLDSAILDQYLDNGGSIVSLIEGRFDKLAPFLGIKEERRDIRASTGYRIESGFFTGENVSIVDRTVQWDPGWGIPGDNAEILATDYSKRIPLLWKTKINNGNVLVWNWGNFVYGEFLGYILESFIFIQPIGVAATPALSIMYLDDWPLPMYNVVKNPITTTDTDFYTEVWWGEIKELLNSWKQPFTSYAIFNYNAMTKPPFETGEFFVAKGNAPTEIAYEHLDTGIELGLHGYNHVSPTLQKSSINAFVWSSKDEMEIGFTQAKNEWVRLLGDYSLPRTYVAPHNIISTDGIEVLHKVFPTIKSISTLRAGEGEGETHDFGPHPDFPEIYMMPRMTSGYIFTSEIKSGAVSGIVGPGLWSHFIHGDDVFDAHRSQGKSWDELKTEFSSMLGFVRKNYPWLRPMNAYDGYRAMEEFDDIGTDFKFSGDDLLVQTGAPGLIFRMRFEGKKIKSITGGTLLYTYKSMDAAVIQADSPEVRVEFR
ncbi:MAG: DUF2194 domain-containing protein [Spirochaetia bacterium]|jgi:hypothetical protein|nr:DUF2194 domain-containing protein [Spirochaetia bacterium]